MALNFPNSPANGQIYVANTVTYVWTGYSWQSSVTSGSKGQKGELGDKGDIGPVGSKGDKGDLGSQGVKGEKGLDGAAAAKGDKGDKGFVGTQGSKGTKGERVTVWKGSSPPVDTELLWYNTVDGNFLIYYNDGDTPYWVDASPTVVGDKGDKGTKGDTILTLENSYVSNTITSNSFSTNTANIVAITSNTITSIIANVGTLTSVIVSSNSIVSNTANVTSLHAVNLTVTGNLVTSGNVTYINTTELNIGDNNIVLNADLPSDTAPMESAGITVNRGSLANVQLLWDESNARWTIGGQTLQGSVFTGESNTSLTANNSLNLGGQPASIYASTGKAIAMAIVFGG